MALVAPEAPEHVTRLTVTGPTDTVGSDAYNIRLSRRCDVRFLDRQISLGMAMLGRFRER